MRHTASQ